MRLMFRITLLVICCSLLGAPAGASEKISGVFSADRACDAYKSFAKGTNPGLIKTGPGEDYEAVEVDNKDMAWVRIKVPGISDPLRWVPAECGRIKLGTAVPERPAPGSRQRRSLPYQEPAGQLCARDVMAAGFLRTREVQRREAGMRRA